MSVDRFMAHLADRKPRFECSAAGDASGTRRLHVTLAHDLGPPANSMVIARLREIAGAGYPDVEALYAAHDGMDLYVQRDVVGLSFFPVAKWAAATESFRDGLADWGRDDDDLYDFERQGIVIGEPPASGNCILLYDGRVHYWDHDGGDDTPLAENMSSLLDRLCDDPAAFLYDLGCYARYSDGCSETQWIPERYLVG